MASIITPTPPCTGRPTDPGDKICAYEFLPCRCFSERRDRIAAFHLEAVESLTGQAGLCVAGIDSRLAGLVVKQEVGPSVAVHILDVAGAVRLRAIALCWIVGVSETDGARIDSGGIESVSCEDGDRDETVASEVDRVPGAPRLDVD